MSPSFFGFRRIGAEPRRAADPWANAQAISLRYEKGISFIVLALTANPENACRRVSMITSGPNPQKCHREASPRPG